MIVALMRVIRASFLDSPTNRSDFSHRIHADNCVISNDGFCHREDPAYTWRDYSAILYLNEDFEGGEFFFVENRTTHRVQSTVRPRCGRVVAFSAGGENLHGVRGVRSGKRCAVALWFTHDEKYLEYERVVAETILTRVRTLGVARPPDDDRIPLRYAYLSLFFPSFPLLAILKRTSPFVTTIYDRSNVKNLTFSECTGCTGFTPVRIMPSKRLTSNLFFLFFFFFLQYCNDYDSANVATHLRS